MSQSVSLSLSNLRAIVILIVVAFHSALPYLASQPAEPFAFDAPPYMWVAFPILDRVRWFGFDLFCASQDVSLMTLMFFLAGLFTPASLRRKGPSSYLRGRLIRIGLPFVLAITVLSPLAYSAAYWQTAAAPSLEGFRSQWADLPFWPEGPQWFLWQLLALCVIATALFALAPGVVTALGARAAQLRDRPWTFCSGLTVVTLVAYVPMALAFTPWAWGHAVAFSLQLSRPLHYLVWFFVAFALGVEGPDRGLLREHGPLVRAWAVLVAWSIAGFAAWGLLTSLTLPDFGASPLAARLGAAVAFPVACAGGVLGSIAVALRFLRMRAAVLDSLSVHAYGIYLVHYVFVVWLQYSLLDSAFGAIGKFATVFCAALVLSWATVAAASAAARGLRQSLRTVPADGAVSGEG